VARLLSICWGQPHHDDKHAVATCPLSSSSLGEDPRSRQDDGTAGAKYLAASATATAKLVIGIVACTTARSSAMTNAMDFVAWWQRGTMTMSSSFLGNLGSRQEDGAAGAKEVARSATPTAKFVVGIVACTMAGSSTLVFFSDHIWKA
jgi:hypothetical protein